jgi:putative membrane protein
MKVVIINDETKKINVFIDWLIYMLGYTVVLIAVSLIFKKTMYIDNSMFGLWGFLAAVIIYILNKTIKPILVWLTLPITGLTLGLFYPFINVFILNIVEFILEDHFHIEGILMSFLVAILISLMTTMMNNLIIDPIIKRGEKYE